MARLIIRRENRLINIFRKYQIKVNGNKQVAISNKEVREIELPEGTYQLQANIDWVGSPEVTVTLNDSNPVEIEVGCNTSISLPQAILSILSFVWVIIIFGVYEHMPWQGWMVLIFLWFLNDVILTRGKSFIYYLTKGRNDYLFIRNTQPS